MTLSAEIPVYNLKKHVEEILKHGRSFPAMLPFLLPRSTVSVALSSIEIFT